MTLQMQINGRSVALPTHLASKPLLHVLRDHLGLVGSKFGCGVGVCGACTIHVDGQAARSCVVITRSVTGRSITTIEGLAGTAQGIANGTTRDQGRQTYHPLQQAWIDERVPQCGYCQAGQLMTASALLQANPSPTESDIREAMRGNLCRCGTYQRIIKAITRVAEQSEPDNGRETAISGGQ